MSATGTRIPSSEAAPVAKRFVALIEPYCERVQIAGSLRRRLPTCGDIEIVAVPRVMEIESITAELFGDRVEVREEDRLHGRLMELLEAGTIQKRPIGEDGTSTRFGPRTKYLLFEGVPFDVFSTDADIFGWTLVLRTGPAEFSRQLVQGREVKTSDRRRGLLPAHLTVSGGLHSRLSGLLIPTPEERQVFEVLGLRWQEPWERR